VAETVLNRQEPRLDPGTDTQRQNSYFKRIVGVILFLIIITLTIYALSLQHQNFNILSKSTDLALTASDHATVNYRTYVGRYKETKIELDETTRKLEEVNRQLDQVTTELSTTKSMLSQTQGMLSEAQEENAKLNQELQGLNNLRNTENVNSIGELQAKIQTLKDRDSQVSLQLAQLKSQMRAFPTQFSNLDEGRSLIVLFQNKIKLVKSHMRYLKQEAFFAKVAAQKEKDRLAVLNGNSGFVVRNGQVQNLNATNKSFAIDVKIVN
jgi:septal ring factor EnvC (AmiA/AmiB activator)